MASTASMDFGEPFNLPNHPVVGVTWYEALAFTRWLTAQLQTVAKAKMMSDGLAGASGPEREYWSGLASGKLAACLPSEPEWEKAARGGLELQGNPKRRYPWGDDPDSERANIADTGIGTTSAVGCFPEGRSPYGCEDMSGNVWEWCMTQWRDDYRNYKPDDSVKGSESRVVRGGSWRGDQVVARCSYRVGYNPVDRYNYVGFRVVVRPALFPTSAL